MKFKQYLNEIMNNSVEYRITNSFGTEWYGDFDIKNYTFNFQIIEIDPYIEGEGVYEIVFSLYPDSKIGIENIGIKIALKVFATVKNIIRDFMRKTSNFKELRFLSSEPSRTKLYRKIGKSLKSLKYTFEEQKNSKGIMFIITRQ